MGNVYSSDKFSTPKSPPEDEGNGGNGNGSSGKGTESRLTRLETHMEYVATKEDIESTKTAIESVKTLIQSEFKIQSRWLIATGAGIATALVTLLIRAFSN